MDEHILLVCAAAEGYLIKKTLLNLKVTSAPLMDTYSYHVVENWGGRRQKMIITF